MTFTVALLEKISIKCKTNDMSLTNLGILHMLNVECLIFFFFSF